MVTINWNVNVLSPSQMPWPLNLEHPWTSKMIRMTTIKKKKKRPLSLRNLNKCQDSQSGSKIYKWHKRKKFKYRQVNLVVEMSPWEDWCRIPKAKVSMKSNATMQIWFKSAETHVVWNWLKINEKVWLILIKAKTRQKAKSSKRKKPMKKQKMKTKLTTLKLCK